MASLSTKQFVELVQKSQLVPKSELISAVEKLKGDYAGNVPASADVLAQQMINDRQITDWQYEQLKSGKYRGFFLGKYRLLSHLGSGGMSSVYLADHTRMNRRVALKVLPKARVGEKSYLDRFYREAQAVAALDHPNIVRAYDVDSEGDTHYLVMEYVPGADLNVVVRQSDRHLGLGTVANYIAQAALGLQHAHDAGLIHRDVKPANLLVNDQGTVKLLDLGLAMFAEKEDSSLTEEHKERVLGTADYLAPEQAINSHDVDSRADIYGLGCTMYFAITGRPPFNEGTLAQRIAQHQTVDPPAVRQIRPDCPDELADICHKMMRKSPDERFQTVGEIAHELDAWRSSARLVDQAAGEMPVIVTADQPRAPTVPKRGERVAGEAAAVEPGEIIVEHVGQARTGRGRRKRAAKKPPLVLWVSFVGLCVVAAALAYLIYSK